MFLWNNLSDPVFDGVGLLLFSLLLSFYRLGLRGWASGLIACKSLSPSLALPTFFNNNDNNNKNIIIVIIVKK